MTYNRTFAPGVLREAVLNHIDAHPERVFTDHQLADVLGADRGSIAATATSLIRDGLIGVFTAQRPADAPPRTIRLVRYYHKANRVLGQPQNPVPLDVQPSYVTRDELSAMEARLAALIAGKDAPASAEPEVPEDLAFARKVLIDCYGLADHSGNAVILDRVEDGSEDGLEAIKVLRYLYVNREEYGL